MVFIAISGLDTGYITLDSVNSAVIVELIVSTYAQRSGSSSSAVSRLSRSLFLNSLSSYCLVSQVKSDRDGILAILSNVQYIVLSRPSRIVPTVVLNDFELDVTSGQIQLSLLPFVDTSSQYHVVSSQSRVPSLTEDSGIATCYSVGVSRRRSYATFAVVSYGDCSNTCLTVCSLTRVTYGKCCRLNIFEIYSNTRLCFYENTIGQRNRANRVALNSRDDEFS